MGATDVRASAAEKRAVRRTRSSADGEAGAAATRAAVDHWRWTRRARPCPGAKSGWVTATGRHASSAGIGPAVHARPAVSTQASACAAAGSACGSAPDA